MHKSIFHSDTLCPILAGMICICCLLSGCRMQARTEMFPSKEGYLVTIGEAPTDKRHPVGEIPVRASQKACK